VVIVSGLRDPAEALAGVQLACSHPMCRPGSAECLDMQEVLEALARANGTTVAEEVAAYQSRVRYDRIGLQLARQVEVKLTALIRTGPDEQHRRIPYRMLAEQFERSTDRLNALLRGGPYEPPEDNRTPHEMGCTVAEPCTECRPGGRGTAAERARHSHGTQEALNQMVNRTVRGGGLFGPPNRTPPKGTPDA